MKKKSVSMVNVVLLVVLVALVAVSAYFTFSVPKKAPVVEQKPQMVEADFLGADCAECFNLSIAFDFLNKQPGMKLAAVRNRTSSESEELAAKYNITRLPALVFSTAPPPYFDVKEGKVKGIVSVIKLEASCPTCFNTSILVDQLRASGVVLGQVQSVRAGTGEGNALVAKYKIEKIPTLIFNSDALEYEVISQVWPAVGSTESDGALVLRVVNPPYVNVSTGKEEGLVSMTYLVDASCNDCLNESTYQELFEKGFGMRFSEIKSVDVSSARGKLLVNKYAIELVPTVVLSNDAKLYPVVDQVWSQAGTQENDGSFVFRSVQLIENVVGGPITYKNLTSNSTVDTTKSALEEPDVSPATPDLS